MRLALFALTSSALAACKPTPPPTKPLPPFPPIGGPGTPAVTTGSGSVVAAPVAEVKPVIDKYFDTSVEDRYRWLESASPETTAWTTGQDTYARTTLAQLPGVAALREEIKAIVAAPDPNYRGFVVAGDSLFARRTDPAKQQPELVMIKNDDVAHAKLVLDPTAGGDAHRAIDWYVPSPDGTRLAISISESGSESGTLHVVDLDGKDLEPPIPDVQRGTAGGDVAWSPDGKSLYVTKYPAGGGSMQVWFHEIGKPTAGDRYELGKELAKISEILLQIDAKGRLLATVQDGDSGHFKYFLRAAGKWRQLADHADAISFMTFGPADELWFVSHDKAPRGKIMKLRTALADAKLVVAEGPDAIVTDFYAETGLAIAKSGVFVTYQTGGPSELRAFDFAGKPAKAPTLPPVSSIGAVVPWRDTVLVRASSYVEPAAWHRFTPATGAFEKIANLAPKVPADLSKFEVSRETATSKDGTKIPLNIVWPRGAPKDGTTRCLVTGYGGFSSNAEPGFLGAWAPLLSRGVCYIEVNLRGGAEFGEDWHRAGMLAKKQNVFDDFAAAIQYAADQKYTSANKTALIGGSNGGLLMGAMLVQHPELAHAVISIAGIYDSLRNELTENGVFNVPEYGSVTVEAQFRTLMAYSPYHHVGRASYPATLFLIGANDPRVAPWHSKKMIAALQANQAGTAPVLLRVTSTSGHGYGTDQTESIESTAVESAFILANL